jgi:mycothiol system anti-sigma-R factor
MSDTNPPASGRHRDDAVCARILAQAWLVADGELGGDERVVVEEHLAVCEDCAGAISLHKRFKARIAAAHSGERAPRTLHERIRFSLRDIGVSP